MSYSQNHWQSSKDLRLDYLRFFVGLGLFFQTYIDFFEADLFGERRYGESLDIELGRIVIGRTSIALRVEELLRLHPIAQEHHAAFAHEAHAVELLEQVARRLVDREYDCFAVLRYSLHAFNDRQRHK